VSESVDGERVAPRLCWGYNNRHATNDVDGSFIVVDTGPWIFGKKVMLPAGVINRVDLDTETVFVNRTKDQIKNAPEYDEDMHRKDVGYRDRYRSDLGTYYGPGGAGWRDDELT
jgi:ABC-type nitrate/sulfonate/bicarbonate transport system substrate-binding protein